MSRFWKQQLQEFDDKAFIKLLKIFSTAALAAILYAAFFSGFQIVDEFEHLHVSWLVSIGKVPYRDFFEHHNPLLWYISAPIVGAFYDNVAVFYVMRAVSFAISLLTLWYIYKIALFWGNKNGAWLAAALYLGNIITFYNFYQFRPDNFMNLGFIAGLYYWFYYLRRQELKFLIFSFLGFTFSFLFLQKIFLLLLVAEGLILALIFTGRMKIKEVTLAALPALFLLFLFLGLMYVGGFLAEYLELNFRFNQALVYYFERGSFWYRQIFFSLYGFALLTAIYFYKKENIYFRITAVFYGAEFLMRGFYFAPHPNYYTLLTMLAALIISVYAKILMPRYKFLTVLSVILMFLYLGNILSVVDRNSDKYNSYKHYKLADYVHKNSNPDDFLMNGYDMNFNIYRPDVSYYWFGLDMLLPVMELEYNLTQKVDINALMLQYRPKFIYTKKYVDLRALRTYGETKYSQQFIPEIVKELYQPTPFEYLAELK